MPSLIHILGAVGLPLVCIRTCILARKLTPLTPGGTGQGKAPGNPPCISSFKVEGLAAVGCATPNTPQALAHVSAPVRVRRAPPWPSPGAPCFRDVGNRGGHQSHLCPRSARSCCPFACGARAHDSGERVRRSASSAGSAEGSPQENGSRAGARAARLVTERRAGPRSAPHPHAAPTKLGGSSRGGRVPGRQTHTAAPGVDHLPPGWVKVQAGRASGAPTAV